VLLAFEGECALGAGRNLDAHASFTGDNFDEVRAKTACVPESDRCVLASAECDPIANQFVTLGIATGNVYFYEDSHG